MKAKEGIVIPFSSKYNVAAEKEQNVIGSRIMAARENRGWTLGNMADNLTEYGIDLSKAALSKWERGESVPNAYQFIAVCKALDMEDSLSSYQKNYTPDLNEEGLRKVAEYRRDLISSGNYKPAAKVRTHIRYVDMPVALMPAAAGVGNLLDDSEYYETVSFPEDQIRQGADVGIRVSGDSMEPVYHDGQVVWVQKCDELHPGEVGIFIYEGKAYIKVFGEQDPDEDVKEDYTDSYGTVHKQPVLISYNSEKYDPIAVSPAVPLKIFGRVLR